MREWRKGFVHVLGPLHLLNFVMPSVMMSCHLYQCHAICDCHVICTCVMPYVPVSCHLYLCHVICTCVMPSVAVMSFAPVSCHLWLCHVICTCVMPSVTVSHSLFFLPSPAVHHVAPMPYPHNHFCDVLFPQVPSKPV